MKQIIKNIKYRFATEVWKEFCHVIKPEMLIHIYTVKKLIKGDLFMQPVPLHTDKLRARGFNQAKIIAEFFSQILQIPISDVLARKRNTVSQTKLKDYRSRFLNVKEAFEVRQGQVVGQKNFMIVDDVLTTGSTIKEAARTIKNSGASSVLVLTVAVG